MPDYDAARALYNGMIDKRPRLIARCADVGRRDPGGEFRPRQRPRHRHPRRRPQRAGLRQRRRRAGDRPVGDEGRPGRSRGPHGAGRARLHPGRPRPRHPRLRAGGAGRDRLDDRDRRADAGRRPRLPVAQARADDRQPARGRRRARRRQLRDRERRQPSRPLLGAARRRRQLRGGDELPVPAAPGRRGVRRSGRLRHRRGGGDHAPLPRLPAGRAGGAVRLPRAEDRAVDRRRSPRSTGASGCAS